MDPATAARAAVAEHELVGIASDHLTNEVAIHLPFEVLVAFKNALKRFFTAQPWTEADADRLSDLVTPHLEAGWWEHELGLPWKSRALWEKLSPFNSVENIVTPTLVMGGERDWNVPIMNSEQLYQSLRRLGRTTQLVVYPGQFHGIEKPSYRKDLYERYLAWYAQHVKGEEAAPTAKPAN